MRLPGRCPPAAGRRRLHFDFLEGPTELVGKERLEGVVLARNRLRGEPFAQAAEATGESRVLSCGILFRSIGYRGIPIPGVPFDDRRGIFPHRDGRLVDGDDILPGLYAAGWIKRGPTGVIGTNKSDSVETVSCMLEDLAEGSILHPSAPQASAMEELVRGRQPQYLSFADWLRLDEIEVEHGRAQGRPRDKFTRIEDMLAAVAR